MAAQAQLISTPLTLPLPPSALPTPPTYLPRTSGAAGQLTLLIRRGGKTRRGRGDQPGRRGRRGSSTRAEEEAVQEKH